MSEPRTARDHLARGIEFFDAAAYEDAHEEFEEAWLSTQGADSDFYKGLVQASIAMHHFQRGNLEGAARLYSGHRRYLAAYVPAHLGIDVSGLLAEMQRVLQPVLRRTAESAPVFDFDRRPKLASAPR